MILTIDLQKNWDNYPDKELKEKVGIKGVIEAMENFGDTVSDDDYVWYPFYAIYDFSPIKGNVPMPNDELKKKIGDWEKSVLNSD